jgi:hypothetical protein
MMVIGGCTLAMIAKTLAVWDIGPNVFLIIWRTMPISLLGVVSLDRLLVMLVLQWEMGNGPEKHQHLFGTSNT